MSQVASDPSTYAAKPPQSYSARPTPDRAQDQAPATPFASLLDDSTPPPADRPAPPADDQVSRADQAPPAKDPTKPAAKTADKAKSDDSKAADKPADAKTADADGAKPAKSANAKAKSDAKAAADAKAGDLTAAGDAKPAPDAKPADVAANIPAAAATPDAAAIAPVANIVPLAAAPAEAITAANPALLLTAAKPNALASLETGIKAADTPKTPAKTDIKTATQPQTGDKAQTSAATVTSDQDAVAQARGEMQGNGHHGANAETPGANTADTAAAAPKGADAAQPSALTLPTHTTAPSSTTTIAAAPQLAPQAAAIPLAGVAIEIAAKAEAGTNHFEIRLDPPELGRIEVRLNVDRDGNVTTSMIADRSDTLDLLRRDSAGLERALQDAGLKTGDNSLQFSLRDQTNGQPQNNDGAELTRINITDDMVSAADSAQRIYSRLAGQGGGLDIHV